MEVTSYLLGKKSGGGGGTLQEKSVTITENGTTNITADSGYDGLSKAVVTTNVPASGPDLSDYFTDTITSGSNSVAGFTKSIKKMKKPTTVVGTSLNNAYYYYAGTEIDLSSLDASDVTNMNSMFFGCSNLANLNLTGLNTSNVTNMASMFSGCYSLTSLDLSSFTTSKVTSFAAMFSQCSNLVTLNLSSFDFGACTAIHSIFNQCTKLENLTFGTNLGKAYPPNPDTGIYGVNTLNLKNCSSLTHDSLMSVINNLYDVTNITTTNNPELLLPSNYSEKISADEVAIATNKGWTVK